MWITIGVALVASLLIWWASSTKVDIQSDVRLMLNYVIVIGAGLVWAILQVVAAIIRNGNNKIRDAEKLGGRL